MQKRIPISKVAEHLGINMHKSTAIRWTMNGVVVNGKRVKLPATRLGNRIFVDENDLNVFVAKLNEREATPPISEKPKNEILSQIQSSERLDELGI